MYGTRDINTTKINCICATNPHCQSSAAIYAKDVVYFGGYDFHVDYVILGFVTGCSPLDSLLLSTLECLYSTSDCLSNLTHFIRETYFYNVEHPSWLEVRPLTYNSTLDQFPPNTSISNIVSKLMISRWNSAISYAQFYQSCAPDHCSYSKEIQAKTLLGIVVTLVSMIGGVSVVLRLITPHLVKLLMDIFTKRSTKEEQSGNVCFLLEEGK